MDNEAQKLMIILNYVNSNLCFIRTIRVIRGQRQTHPNCGFHE